MIGGHDIGPDTNRGFHPGNEGARYSVFAYQSACFDEMPIIFVGFTVLFRPSVQSHVTAEKKARF